MDGVAGVKVDFAVQLMGVRKYVVENYQELVPNDFKLVLEGAAAGYNAWAKAHPDELPIRHKGLFPVLPADILCGYMLGLGLMGGIDGAVGGIADNSTSTQIKDIEPVLGLGSNAFALNKNKTADGGTFLNINSHQPMEGLLSLV